MYERINVNNRLKLKKYTVGIEYKKNITIIRIRNELIKNIDFFSNCMILRLNILL